MKRLINKIIGASFFRLLFIGSVLMSLVVLEEAESASKFQISGFYLGATPDELGVAVEVDPELDQKYFEVETSGVHLFFIRNLDSGILRLYRVVKEEPIGGDRVAPVLDNLKSKYGIPDKQTIRTNSVRPKRKTYYITTVKNKAVWNIAETQDFVAEIETSRVTYELIDHDPENIGAVFAPEKTEDGSPGGEGWDPNY